MSEDERVIAELRARARRLIDEAESANASLTADIRGLFAQWIVVTQRYAVIYARSGERDALLALANRVGRRSILFARRSEVAAERYAVESDLHDINLAIGAVQIAICAGKLAEVGIGIYAWFGKIKTAGDTLKFLVRDAGEIKRRVDRGKLIVDGVKAGSAQVSGALSLAGQGDMSGGDYALATGQLAAYLLRVGAGFDRTGKQLWDLLAMIRRASSAKDMAQIASTAMQLIKFLVDYARNLIDFVENVEPKSGMSPILGTVNTVVTALRDLIDAGRAFVAAVDALQQMSANSARMESALKEQDRFFGSEQAALHLLPGLRRHLDDNAIDALAQRTTNLQETRVLIDEARREAQRIKDAMDAAAKCQAQAREALRSGMSGLGGKMDEMEELLTRMRYQMQDLDFVAGRDGPRAVVARELIEDLSQKRVRFQSDFDHLRSIAAGAR